MALHNELGAWGEQLAAEKLIADGWTIVERNWRMGHLEIDIIAQKDDTIVVAEVKTRSSHEEDPLEAVDKRKIANMVRSADTYLHMKGLTFSVRFDLFAITGRPGDYRLEHIPDAFYPPLKTYR